MTQQLDIDLSPELEKFRDKIEATVKPFVKITAKENQKLTWWQSKFGGLPYLPKNYDYPRDSNGKPLYLLAQINFAEVPDSEDFPSEGILQFYISEGDSWGQDLENAFQQDKFRVIYFPEIIHTETDLITDFSFLPEPEDLPFEESCSLQFEQQIAPVNIWDGEFDEVFGEDFFAQFGEKEEEISGEYDDKFPADGHKIGGYAYFTQSDPRPYLSKEKYVLLLQVDTDEEVGIMWGDVGVCNFFIKPEDLEQLDFSNVLYNWDCH
jgi:uncharacterized protein YwqG